MSCLVVLAGADPGFAVTKVVTVTDTSFSPDPLKIRQGGIVQWDFSSTNIEEHNVSTFLFDSGQKEAGASYSFKFIGAGRYTVTDTLGGLDMTVFVPITASPGSSPSGKSCTIRWASQASPDLVWNVQVKGPYPDAPWQSLFRNRTQPSYEFSGHSGGTYGFRAQTALAPSGFGSPKSDWSKPVYIEIGTFLTTC